MKIKHRVNTFRMLALRHVTFCLQAGNLLFHSDILQQCILHGNFTRHVEHDGLQTKTFPSQESFRVQNYLLGFLLLSSTISSSLKNHHFGTWMCFPTFQQKTNHHPPPHPPSNSLRKQKSSPCRSARNFDWANRTFHRPRGEKSP